MLDLSSRLEQASREYTALSANLQQCMGENEALRNRYVANVVLSSLPSCHRRCRRVIVAVVISSSLPSCSRRCYRVIVAVVMSSSLFRSGSAAEEEGRDGDVVGVMDAR
jgi:hypothetical protein